MLEYLDYPRQMVWQALGLPATGSELLKQMGVENETLAGVGGFGLEMIADPLNLLGAGLAGKAAKAGKAVRAANEESALLRHLGAMPEEIAAKTLAVDEAGNPLKVFHGTTGDFGRFDPAKLDPYALYGPGYYTTRDAGIAGEYAVERAEGQARKLADVERSLEQHQGVRQRDLARQASGEAPYYGTWEEQYAKHDRIIQELERQRQAAQGGANIRPHFLDAQKPFDATAVFSPEEQAQFFGGNVPVEDFSPLTGKEFYRQLSGDGIYRADANKALMDAGYDAIRYPGGEALGGRRHDVWVGLDPFKVYAPLVAPAFRTPPSASPILAGLGVYNAGARTGF